MVIPFFSFVLFVDDGITTEGVFRILLAVKNYPRLSSLSFDRMDCSFVIMKGNLIDDSFYQPFKVFIQDSLIFPSLRRISLLGDI